MPIHWRAVHPGAAATADTLQTATTVLPGSQVASSLEQASLIGCWEPPGLPCQGRSLAMPLANASGGGRWQRPSMQATKQRHPKNRLHFTWQRQLQRTRTNLRILRTQVGVVLFDFYFCFISWFLFHFCRKCFMYPPRNEVAKLLDDFRQEIRDMPAAMEKDLREDLKQSVDFFQYPVRSHVHAVFEN